MVYLFPIPDKKNQSGEVYLVSENCAVLDANVVKLCVCDTDSPTQGHCARKQKISHRNHLTYLWNGTGPIDKGETIFLTNFEWVGDFLLKLLTLEKVNR